MATGLESQNLGNLAERQRTVSFSEVVDVFPVFTSADREGVDCSSVMTDSLESNPKDAVKTRCINFHTDQKPLLVLPGRVNKREADLIIDTGAEVTVISERIASKFKHQPEYREVVNLVGAVPGSKAEAKLAKNLEFKFGSSTFYWDVYVAPIEEDAILGLDFLMYHKVKVDLANHELCINGISHGAKQRCDNTETFKVSRIAVAKRTVVPPQTTVHVSCELEHPMDSAFSFQPKRTSTTALMPHVVLNNGSTTCALPITTDTDRYLNIKKDIIVECAVEVDYIIDEPEAEDDDLCFPDRDEQDTTRTFNVFQTSKSTDNGDILPDHLTNLFETSKVHLTPDNQMRLRQLLIEFQDVFSKGDHDLGCFTDFKFGIDTEDAPPVKHKLRRTPLGFEKEEEAHLNKMLDSGIIRKSTSNWASSPVLVRKKDGSVRYCLDYRDLNAKTVKDRWPLPSISSCLDTLQGNAWFSSLDLAAGYWQFLIEDKDIPKTAFLTKFGLFEHVRMAFGLTNAPSFCQRAVELVLRGMTWKEIIAYLDDVMVLGSSIENHLENLRKVFLRFRKHNLKLKPKKCHLFQQKVPFLGRLVSKDGVEVDPEKVSAVKRYPIPKNNKDVERFLGFANYHRDFISNFAERTAILYQLTGMAAFEWTEQHTSAFNDIVEALTTAPVLAYPSPDAPFILDTDASDTAIAGVLSQVQNGQERVICYGSVVLSAPQKNYCTTRKELLAIVRFTRQFRHYLRGRTVTVRTDNGSLTWLMRFKNPIGQLARWIEELNQYDIQLIHRRGKLHVNADTLSRIPDEMDVCPHYDGKLLSDLPCGGCKYCERAHKNWARFDEDIDDVVPLAFKPIKILQMATSSLSNWIDAMSEAEIVDAQKQDPDLAVVINYLHDNEEPDEATLFLQSASAKFYWTNRNLLKLDNSVVKYQWSASNGDIRWLIVIPSSLKNKCLELAHDNPVSGHMGRDKTLQKLLQSGYWHSIRKDSDTYVESCSACSRNKKATRKAKQAQRNFHAGYPMERVHLDMLGGSGSRT